MGFWDLSGWDARQGDSSEVPAAEVSGIHDKQEEEEEEEQQEGQNDDRESPQVSEEEQEEEEVPQLRPRRRAARHVQRTSTGSDVASSGDGHNSSDSEFMIITPHRATIIPAASSSTSADSSRVKKGGTLPRRSRRTHPQPQESLPSPTSSPPPPSPQSRKRSAESHHGPSAKRTARPPRKERDKVPKLQERSPAMVAKIWDYFLDSAYSQLPLPKPRAKIGTVPMVKTYMLLKVHQMWVEGRIKYCRRNLDNMSIMLSTWKTARVSNGTLSFG